MVTATATGLRMLGNETSKSLRVMWVHKGPLVLQLALMSVLYWQIQLFIGGGRFVPELLALTFAGYLAYVINYIALLPWRGDGGWAWTFGTAVGWFAAGLLVFRVCERVARRRGALSQSG